MALLRRDGRLRPGTLWILFVVALLAGAAAGWSYHWYTQRTLSERAHGAVRDVKSAVDRATR